MDAEKAFHIRSPRIRLQQPVAQGRFCLQRHHLAGAIELQAPAVGVVHQEQGQARIGTQVARGEQLAVAAVIGEAEGALIEHPQKPHRPAAVLDVGRSRLGEAGQVEAVAGADEGDLPRPEAVGLRGVRHRVGRLPIGLLLGFAHGGGEMAMEIVLAHGWRSVQASRPFIGR